MTVDKIMNTNESNCRKYKPLLSEFIDGALDGSSSWIVQKHLAICADCSQLASEMQKTAGLLIGLDRREVSAQFDSALKARIALASARREAQTKIGPFRLVSRWLYGAFIAAGINSRKLVALPIAAIGAICLLTILLVPNAITRSTQAPAPVTNVTDPAVANISDAPLSDPSAQALANQVDSNNISTPVTNSSAAQSIQATSWTDNDSAALLGDNL